jgi:hypothetical protein
LAAIAGAVFLLGTLGFGTAQMAHAAPLPANIVTTDLGGVASVPTGGPFNTNKTLVGTVDLTAGTYTVSVNAKATPNAVTTGAVFPQFFVYNGAALPTWTNDLFNVGNGSLEQFTTSPLPSNLIDSYYSGSGVVTVPAAGETLDVYAFGYDSGGGLGSYKLDDLTVTATKAYTHTVHPYIYGGHIVSVNRNDVVLGWKFGGGAQYACTRTFGYKMSVNGSPHLGLSGGDEGFWSGLAPGHTYDMEIYPCTYQRVQTGPVGWINLVTTN